MGKARAEIIIEHASVSKADAAVKKLTTDIKQIDKADGGKKVARNMRKVKDNAKGAAGSAKKLGSIIARLALPATLLAGLRSLITGLETARAKGTDLGTALTRSAVLAGTTTEAMSRRMHKLAGGLVSIKSASDAIFAARSAVDDPEVAKAIAEQAIKAEALGQGGAGGIARSLGEYVKRRGIKTRSGVAAGASQLFSGAKGSKAAMGEFSEALLDMMAVASAKLPGRQLKTEEALGIFQQAEAATGDTATARPMARNFLLRLISPEGKKAKKIFGRAGITKNMSIMERIEALQKAKLDAAEIKDVFGLRTFAVASGILKDPEALRQSIATAQGAGQRRMLDREVATRMKSDSFFRYRSVRQGVENRKDVARLGEAGRERDWYTKAKDEAAIEGIEKGQGEGMWGTLYGLSGAPDVGDISAAARKNNTVKDAARGLMLPQKVEIVNPDDAGRGPGARP